jgi:hypothetical protein
VAAAALPDVPPPPAGANPWLATINWWRSFGSAVDGSAFPAVTQADPRHLGPQHQVDYLMEIRALGSQYCSHFSDFDYPRPEPDDYYEHNILFCGPATLTDAVDGWMITPYHGPPILAPEVVEVDGGSASYLNDTAHAAVTASVAPIDEPYIWPADDGVLPRAEMTTGESPEPRAYCPPDPGKNPGQPVYAWYPSDDLRKLVSATVSDPGGPVPFCASSAQRLPDTARSTPARRPSSSPCSPSGRGPWGRRRPCRSTRRRSTVPIRKR